MFVRNIIGGMVFYKDQVLLLQNEKNEWVFPVYSIQGIEDEKLRESVLIQGIEEYLKLPTKILRYVGRTSYEFYSYTRRRPVCNDIRWYLLSTLTDEKPFLELIENEKYCEAGFFDIEAALDMITYSKDKAKLIEAYTVIMKKKFSLEDNIEENEEMYETQTTEI